MQKTVVRMVLVLLAAVLAFGSSLGSANAQAAKGAPWQVSITYQNVSPRPATVKIDFYPGGGADVITFNRPEELPAGAGTSLSVASVSGITSGFKGSAIISASELVVATVVQFAGSYFGGRNVRPLSNGFQPSDASSQYTIPTVLNGSSSTVTEFSVQNVEDVTISINVKFYRSSDAGLEVEKNFDILPGESKHIDASASEIGLPAGFNGSAIITAVRQGTSTAANIVAVAYEYNNSNPNASSFEGVKEGATTIYMPSALCDLTQTGSGPETFYAIQNASLTANATIRVVFRKLDGTVQLTTTNTTLGAGQKTSVAGCAAGLPAGFNGSATIESLSVGGAAATPIVAIGKVGRAGLSTSFVGQSSGADTLALPYVRWSPSSTFGAGTRQRTFIAVQNLSGSPVTVDVEYLGRDGSVIATEQLTIAGFAKANSNPSTAGALGQGGNLGDSFGEYSDGFGGAAIIRGPDGSQLIATARVNSGFGGLSTGEDYNAIPVP